MSMDMVVEGAWGAEWDQEEWDTEEAEGLAEWDQ